MSPVICPLSHDGVCRPRTSQRGRTEQGPESETPSELSGSIHPFILSFGRLHGVTSHMSRVEEGVYRAGEGRLVRRWETVPCLFEIMSSPLHPRGPRITLLREVCEDTIDKRRIVHLLPMMRLEDSHKWCHLEAMYRRARMSLCAIQEGHDQRRP